MASPLNASGRGTNPKLPNHPNSKLPPIPKGTRIQKRPLPGPSPAARSSASLASFSDPADARLGAGAADPDGYLPPPRATHTSVIKVTSGAPFMSLVSRVRKALDKAPSQGEGRRGTSTKGLGLTARLAALGVQGKGGPPLHQQQQQQQQHPQPQQQEQARGPVGDGMDDVVLVATGRAISKAVDVGAFFTRERDLAVLVRTRTVLAVDDVVAEDEAVDMEDQVRVRNLSCVEVGIRWAL